MAHRSMYLIVMIPKDLTIQISLNSVPLKFFVMKMIFHLILNAISIVDSLLAFPYLTSDYCFYLFGRIELVNRNHSCLNFLLLMNRWDINFYCLTGDHNFSQNLDDVVEVAWLLYLAIFHYFYWRVLAFFQICLGYLNLCPRF